MKVSDILLIVAGVAGLGGAYLSYNNYSAYVGDPFGDRERASYTQSTPLVPVQEARETEKRKSEGQLSDRKDDLAQLNQEIADLDEVNQGLQGKIDEGTIERTNLMGDIDRLDREISKNEETLGELKRYLEKFGTAEELLAKVDTLQSELNTAKQTLATEKNSLTSLISRQESLDSSIASQRENIEMSQTGRMRSSFSSSVTEVYPRWGFVVIRGGSGAGVNVNTTLDVRRGSETIGQVTVSTVEPSVSVCAIVDDSFAEGVQIRPGDTVVPGAKEDKKAN